MLRFIVLSLALLASSLVSCESFTCPGKGTFPNPDDCNSYYVCSDSGVVKMKCPVDTAFDPILKICQYAENVNCGGSTTTSTTKQPETTSTTKKPETTSTTTTTTTKPSSSTSTTQGGAPNCPSTGIHFIENPADCGTFYVCVEGQHALNTCPAGYGFDPVSEDCVKAELVGCSSQTSTTPNPNAPVSCPPTGLQPYPNPSDCSTFFICQNGNLDIITCPVGYEFDTIDTRCEVIGSAQCNGEVTSSSVKPHTTEKPNYNCDDHPNGSTFPDPTDCTKYYQCSNGNVVGNHCAPGLEFNAELKVCDKPENAQCHVTPSSVY